jgi:glycerol-3-phosphate dehydrogenase
MWDVVIIGAGVVGCAAARELSRYDLSVLVLEKGSDLCAATSKGNSATVHAGYDPDPGTLKAVYNIRGNPMFDDLRDELGIPFIRNGMLVFATSEKEMEEVYRLEKLAEANEVPVEILRSREEVVKIEPHIGNDVVGALFAPTGGMVCPYTMTIAMAENAAINGVEFRCATRATAVEPAPEGWKVTATDGSEERGKGMQEFLTRLVFNCAGTHADIFNNMVSERKIKITPRHGEHIILDKTYRPYVNASLNQPPTALPGGGHTKGMGVMPSTDGTIILGCDAVNVEDRDDMSTTASGLQSIIDYFVRNWKHLPIGNCVDHVPVEDFINAYGGVRAHPDGDDFIIGEAPDAPGFINAAGIESPGLTAAPAIGLDLATLAAEKLNASRKENYTPGRRFKKAFRDMSREERKHAISADPDYAKLVCRCEQVTEAEIRDAIHRPLGARTVGAVKFRARAGMGRCQGGFCGPRVLQILSEELKTDPLEITLQGTGSNILLRKACSDAVPEAGKGDRPDHEKG